jgi:hypothetical protein
MATEHVTTRRTVLAGSLQGRARGARVGRAKKQARGRAGPLKSMA